MKCSWNSTNIVPITLSFLFLFIFNFRDVYAAPTKYLCRPEQRDALLEFKSEFEVQKPCFISPHPKTESWKNNSDCCNWKGITCDAKSGEVIELDLSFSCLDGRLHYNSSLFRLQNFRFLTTLDLSFNNFSDQLPSSIGNLSHLTFLDLAFNRFSGQIPSSLGNLSQLTYLSLSSNNFVGEIPSSFDSLNQLTSLIFSYNKLSGNFHTALLNLTELSELSLSKNQFTGTLPPNMDALSNLESFDASGNSFVGTLPSSLFSLPYLTILDLRDNQLNGTLEFGNISSPSKLKQLYIGNNHFKGPIPRSISKLINLDVLDLSYFNTQGPVDFCIFSHLKSLIVLDISHLNTTAIIDLNAIVSCFKTLFTLDLSGSHVSATNKSSIAVPPSQLRHLNLSGCGITEFPEFLRTQQQIMGLDLSKNRIKGQVPSWLWSLSKLETVDLSSNNFSGFDLRSYDFQATSFVPPPPINTLIASKNNFSGEILKSICGMTSLQVLDLSNNRLNGSIPQCLENLIKKYLLVLNLGDNHLSGKLPEIFLNGSHLKSLNIGHNQLVGKLPRSLSDCSSLEVLNLEHNRINDTFPIWLQPLKQLQVLVLRSNAFHGSLHPPNISSGFLELQIIDVSKNDFMGTLPSDFFMYWSAMSSEKDRSELKYIGESYYQDSLVLMNKGVEAKMERVLTLLTAIDFSGNKLRGKIPESIGVLKGLIVLNLSNNHFEGHIPSSMANLTELESLDLSRNMLSGTIPPQLGKLTFVEFVDFSHNKLVGMIPGSTQFQTQNPSRFQDNVGLCGSPLDECGVVHEPSDSQQSEEEEEEVLSWIAAAIGFAPGIILGLSIGYVMISSALVFQGVRIR